MRSLELELERLLTTGTFNLLSKIRAISALGGRFGFGRHETLRFGRRPRNLSNILRCFPCCQPENLNGHQGAPGAQNAHYAAPIGLVTRNSARKGTGAFEID